MQEASHDVTAGGNRRIGTLARVASVDVTFETVCTGQHTAIERATVHAWNIAQCHCIIVIVATLFTAGWSWYTETLAIMGNSALFQNVNLLETTGVALSHSQSWQPFSSFLYPYWQNFRPAQQQQAWGARKTTRY